MSAPKNTAEEVIACAIFQMWGQMKPHAKDLIADWFIANQDKMGVEGKDRFKDAQDFKKFAEARALKESLLDLLRDLKKCL